MKILLEPEDPERFGATFPLTAQLSDEVVKELDMEPALTRFAARLVEQYKDAKLRDGDKRIIGVELHEINFSFVLRRV